MKKLVETSPRLFQIKVHFSRLKSFFLFSMIRRLLSSANMSKLGLIKFTETAGAGVIQFNRPEALNALTLEMFR